MYIPKLRPRQTISYLLLLLLAHLAFFEEDPLRAFYHFSVFGYCVDDLLTDVTATRGWSKVWSYRLIKCIGIVQASCSGNKCSNRLINL